jgi:hypothetical protein
LKGLRLSLREVLKINREGCKGREERKKPAGKVGKMEKVGKVKIERTAGPAIMA